MSLVKSLLTVVFLFSLSITSFCQDEAQVKDAIAAIATSYTGWQNSSCYYMIPGDYIKEETTGKIVGQKFIFPNNTKEYEKVILVNEEGAYAKATLGNKNIYLDWSGDKVSRVHNKHLSRYDYQLQYNADNKVTKMVGQNGHFIDIVYDGDKMTKMHTTSTSKGKSYTSNVGYITHKPDGFSMKIDQYKKGKPQKNKNIRQTQNCYCEKKADHNYEVLHGWGQKAQYTFNETGLLTESEKVHLKSGRTQYEIYAYTPSGEIQRKELRVKENGVFRDTEIMVYNEPSSSEGLEEWQTRKGMFKINENKELVYEAIDTKYREKVNGVWSGWKRRNFCGVK